MNEQTLAEIIANAVTAAVTAALSDQTVAAAPAKPAEKANTRQPKADVRYRSQKALDKGREQASEIWARHYAAAGVRRFKDLTPAQQKAARAEVQGAWKGIKGTRKTKVS